MKYLLIFTAAIVCFNAVIIDGECLKYKVQNSKQQYKTEKDNNKLQYREVIPPPPPTVPDVVPIIPTVKTNNGKVKDMSLEEELAQKMKNLTKTEQNQTLSPDKKMQQEMLAIRAKFNKSKEKKNNIENNNVLKNNTKNIIPIYNQQQYKPVKKVIPEKPKITTEEQLVILDNTYINLMKSMKQLEKIIEFTKSKSTIFNTESMKYKLEQKEQLNKLNTIYNSITKSMRSIKETINNLMKN